MSSGNHQRPTIMVALRAVKVDSATPFSRGWGWVPCRLGCGRFHGGDTVRRSTTRPGLLSRHQQSPSGLSSRQMNNELRRLQQSPSGTAGALTIFLQNLTIRIQDHHPLFFREMAVTRGTQLPFYFLLRRKIAKGENKHILPVQWHTKTR